MKSLTSSLTMILLSLFLFSGNASASTETKVKKETTTGFLQEITEERIYKGPERSGKEIYEFRCKGCHGRNTQGAPMPDDNYAWSTRLRKGFDVLMKHSMEGYSNYLMPPKGGCRNCSEKEVKNAIVYMLKTSGIELPKD